MLDCVDLAIGIECRFGLVDHRQVAGQDDRGHGVVRHFDRHVIGRDFVKDRYRRDAFVLVDECYLGGQETGAGRPGGVTLSDGTPSQLETSRDLFAYRRPEPK